MNPKPSFTSHLKALLLGGAIALSANQSAKAVQAPSDSKKLSPDDRVAKIRESLQGGGNELSASGLRPGASDADVMWWRNAWGNGGWHNWHNGWRNGGGWGNWHNW
ncbi:MAG: hypothetical protein ACOYNN_12675 [Terrimicrobiaceae bacterium]